MFLPPPIAEALSAERQRHYLKAAHTFRTAANLRDPDHLGLRPRAFGRCLAQRLSRLVSALFREPAAGRPESTDPRADPYDPNPFE